ncbi:MAG TPA: diguanylate cyclase [Rhodocyclaceae bacterium]|nr:diguanylate cyclase [Rhodocyclaceae bacterium]
MTALLDDALRDVIDRLDVGVFVLNRDLEVLFWNSFMVANSGKSVSEVIGRKLPELFPELPERWLRKKVDTVFILKNRSFTAWEQRPYLFRFQHNRPVTGGVEHMYQNCTFNPCRGDGDEVEMVAVTLQDVTDLAMAHRALEIARDRLEQSSRVDGLTGLFNRGYWEQCLVGEFKRSKRSGTEFALIMFDLDHFKAINDNYGHPAGDEVLRAVGQCLQQLIRETDIVGRYGGEEFGVIAPDCDLDGACGLAERIRTEIEALSVVHEGLPIHVTTSLGVALCSAEVESHEALIGHADEALYRTKHEGRNSYRVYRSG